MRFEHFLLEFKTQMLLTWKSMFEGSSISKQNFLLLISENVLAQSNISVNKQIQVFPGVFYVFSTSWKACFMSQNVCTPTSDFTIKMRAKQLLKSKTFLAVLSLTLFKNKIFVKPQIKLFT